MSHNKRTVHAYMTAFERTDHAAVLACLTNDVEWEMPGFFHLHGKEAFDLEIENDAFVGSPTIHVTRVTEESDVVVAEGSVQAERASGGIMHGRFCDVFEMEHGKIKKLISYFMEVTP